MNLREPLLLDRFCKQFVVLLVELSWAPGASGNQSVGNGRVSFGGANQPKGSGDKEPKMMAARSQQLKRSLKPLESEDSAARRRSLVELLLEKCLEFRDLEQISRPAKESRRRKH
jgi:hypothetical protein